MNLCRCDNGHFFDKDKYNICPICNPPKDTYLNSGNLDVKKYEAIYEGWNFDSFIGKGSCGKVYKISRKEFGHTYEAALKIIEIPQSKSEVNALQRQGMSERDVTEYFYKMVEDIVEEIVLMSKLKGNSNIVSYEDHSVVPKKDGLGWDIYIRMEILTPLITHIRENKMTVRNVIRLGIDICQALEVCQKYNIIHCDIKPENIFVSNNGTYKLGDFGIARQLEKSSSMLSQKGTFSYMAPEVYKGEKYNSTVDIYSLGIVLYRFLNQNRIPFLPPYPEQTRFTDRKKANIMRFSGQPIPPPKFASEDLSKIILKACSYNEGDRYRNAADLRKDLESLKNIDENPLNYIHEELSSKTEFIDNNSLSYINEAVLSHEEFIDEKTECFTDYTGFDHVLDENVKLNENNKLMDSSNVVPDKLLKKIIKKMINWICFTCLFSLMPLFIYLILSNFSDTRISIINKCITDFLYFGLTISVITIKEMLSFELWKKDHGIYTLALFVIICILIFPAVLFGAMTMNDLNLLNVEIADKFLLKGVIIIFFVSFLTGTFIQIWEVM